jgi:hypothetical protein
MNGAAKPRNSHFVRRSKFVARMERSGIREPGEPRITALRAFIQATLVYFRDAALALVPRDFPPVPRPSRFNNGFQSVARMERSGIREIGRSPGLWRCAPSSGLHLQCISVTPP